MLLVIVIVGGLFVLVSWFLSTRESETYSSPLTPVQIAKAERRTIESSIDLSGYIEAEAMIPVVPFVNGTISSYNIKEGDFVKKGDILCQIDKAPYELQVAQARAASIVYDATYDRIATLVEAGAATKQQLDEIKAQKDAGSAQLELAKSSVADYQKAIDETDAECERLGEALDGLYEKYGYYTNDDPAEFVAFGEASGVKVYKLLSTGVVNLSGTATTYNIDVSSIPNLDINDVYVAFEYVRNNYVYEQNGGTGAYVITKSLSGNTLTIGLQAANNPGIGSAPGDG